MRPIKLGLSINFDIPAHSGTFVLPGYWNACRHSGVDVGSVNFLVPDTLSLLLIFVHIRCQSFVCLTGLILCFFDIPD